MKQIQDTQGNTNLHKVTCVYTQIYMPQIAISQRPAELEQYQDKARSIYGFPRFQKVFKIHISES